MPEDIHATVQDALRAVREAHDAKGVEAAFRAYAGRNSLLRRQLRRIGTLPEAERAKKARVLHEALVRIEQAVRERVSELKELEEAHVSEHERIDVTMPAVAVRRGTLHPLTRVRRDAERIFASLGFSVAEGPEVEDAWRNFDALNIPQDHPARDMLDTFWLEGARKTRNPKSQLLLRTHTSPVQIRYMQEHQPPFRIVVPGQVYRYEATDASHDVQFWQLEGLMVDRRDAPHPVTMATLVSVLKTFFGQCFGKTVALRVRPSYFPFVEPGIEVDLSCVVCSGKGCSVCGQSGWLEMLGAGMVHPKVFDAVGYNPRNVQGFAFGFGIDRLAMLKYRIPDIRLFRYGDVRFLQQFR